MSPKKKGAGKSAAADVLAAMLDAARESLGDDWKGARRYAEPELERLARTMVGIGAQATAGEISAAEARALIRIHRNTTQMVLLTAKGMSLLAAENAVNAAMDAAKAPVNGILGIPLL